MNTEDQSAHVRPDAEDVPVNDPDQGPAAPDSHAPAVAGADVPGVLDTADAGGKPIAQEDGTNDDAGREEAGREFFGDGDAEVGVNIVDGDVLAYDRRNGATIRMDSDGTTVEFTSEEPISPFRMREFISHPDVWNALGTAHENATN